MAITIRRGGPADIPAMHRIRLAVQENRLSPTSGIVEESYLPFLGSAGMGWVAESEIAPVGFAIVDISVGNVWALFVDLDSQGQGVGRALVDAIRTGAVEHGINRLWLATAVGTRAERFYEQLGWTRTASIDKGEVRFELDLGVQAT